MAKSKLLGKQAQLGYYQMNDTFPKNVQLHWNYFLALEKDMEAVSRFIEFCPNNFNTHSIELAHLLLSAASEVDTLAKCVCSILDPNEKAGNIDDYRRIIVAGPEKEIVPHWYGGGNVTIEAAKNRDRITTLEVYVPRYSLTFAPWDAWAANKNPDWWRSYNDVKHERNQHFNKANLKNALNALAALLVMNYLHCRLDITKDKPDGRFFHRGEMVTSHMEPQSTFLRLPSDFYHDPFAEFGGWSYHFRK